jgi:glucose/arabinose dehydrogenase
LPRPVYTLSVIVIIVLVLLSVSFPAPTRAQLRPVEMAQGFEFNIFADPTAVPEFALSAFAGPTSMAFDARGRLFVGTLSGKILILLDNNEDGRVDQIKPFATGVAQPLGLEFRANGDLFATSNRVPFGAGRILRLRDLDGDDVADEIVTIVDGLPSEGDHQTDRLKFGPDGLLYFGQGSSTDNGVPKPGRPPERPLNAAILRVNVDAPIVETFASGLRNPFGMAFHPENGELFSTDGGSGEICQQTQPGMPCPEDLAPPEEVNWVVAGGNYGFPQCEGTPTPGNVGCSGVRPPIQQFPRHLTPTSLVFYTGPQAGEFKNQLLLTLFKNLANANNEGGDLRRLKVEGDAASGFRVTENEFIARFDPIDPFDGPVETAIDPISGDIYVARLDTVTHLDLKEHHHFIYRIHRAGSDALTFIGPVRPASARAGAGVVTITVTGRRLKPGAVILANGVALPTRQGANAFELAADLPPGMTSSEGVITVEVRNPDGTRSNAQQFSVTRTDDPDPTPVQPQIGSVSVYKKKRSRVVDPVTVGSKAKKLRLLVVGEDFSEGAQLLVNGVAVEIRESSATEIVGRFTNSMLAAPGDLAIQVRNADGRVSNTVRVTVAPGQ